jgi:hypothetical protein
MKFKLTMLLCLVAPAVVFAQTNYKPGYIVKSSGDTVKGYIDYREWHRSPKQIQFKSDAGNADVQLFGPANIKAFSVSGETYLAYKGLLSMDKTKTSELSNGVDTSKSMDTVFLKLLIRGPHIALLRHIDNIRTRFFTQEGTDQPQELVYHRFYGDDAHIQESLTYIGQLNLLRNKYDGNEEMGSSSIAYDESDLIRVVGKIEHTQLKVNNDQKLSLYVSVGANYTALQILGTNDFADASGKKSFVPSLGVGFQLFNNPRIQRWVFRGELDLSYVLTDINKTFVYNSFATSNKRYQLNQYTATFSPQVLYNFYNKEKLKFFAGTGLNINFSLYSKNQIITTGYAANTQQNAYDLKNVWLGLPLQIGTSFNNRFEVFAMYDYNAAYTTYVFFNMKNETYRGGLRYHF